MELFYVSGLIFHMCWFIKRATGRNITKNQLNISFVMFVISFVMFIISVFHSFNQILSLRRHWGKKLSKYVKVADFSF